MGKYKEVKINEFPLHEIVSEPGNDSKILVVGKPGSGKSVLIKDIVKTFANKYPIGVVFSGTEENNKFYSEMFQELFIFNGYSEETMKQISERQKLAQKNCKNPKLMLIIDDCSDDPKFFRRPLFQKFLKMGRHMDIMFVLAIQYCNDINSVLKGLFDYLFIFREPNPENRKKIYNNYAGITESLQNFCDLMDQLTGDYTSMVVNNRIQKNDPFECIGYYKARMHNKIEFGCVESKAWSETRYNPMYATEYTL